MIATTGPQATGNRLTCIVSLMTLGLLIIYAVYVLVRKATKSGATDAGTVVGCCGGHSARDGPADAKKSVRFSLADARAFVGAVDTVPEEFKKYKFDVTQTTGVHADWHKDSKALSDMCVTLIRGLAYVIRHGGLFDRRPAGREAVNDARLVIAVTENFIVRLKGKLDAATKPLTRPLWGGADWVPFVCDTAAVLAHYVLLEQSASMRDEAVEIISALITSPTLVLGNKLTDRVEILRVAAPWIVAMYVKGKSEDATMSAGYKQATEEEARIVVKHLKSDSGAHMDHGFYSAQGVVDFDYLARMCDEKISFYYGFDKHLSRTTPLAEWTVVKNIIMHPTVKCGNVGLVGAGKSLKCDANASSELGVKVMPFCGYIRYFTRDRQFSVRAQKEHLAFGVADTNVKDMAQYWVQYRSSHDAKSATEAKYPDVGFINKASQTALAQLTLPVGETYKAFKPSSGVKSFVAAYKHFGVLYQEYEIAEFGQFAVSELIVMNTTKQVVEVKVKIVNRESAELNYYGANVVKNTVPATSTKSYVTTVSMVSGTMETKELAAFPTFPLTLETGLVIKDVADVKSFFLYDNDVPTVWIPYDWTYELPNLVYNVDTTKREIFTFDAAMNQYVNIKNVYVEK